MQTPEEPLRPAAGGINCLVAERSVAPFVDIETKGGGTRAALLQLARDVGAGVMMAAMDEPDGTLEIQLTAAKQEAKDGTTLHKWRVDIWKARQRQYLRVPVRKLAPGEIWTPGAKTPADELATHGIVPLRQGQKLGEFMCPHCGLEHMVPPFTQGRLPRTLTFNCRRCTLPFHVQLVDVAPANTK